MGKHIHHLLLLATAATLLLAGGVHAEVKQTVEGAHSFLRNAPGISIRYVPVGVVSFDGVPAVLSMKVSEYDNVDQNGKHNPCVTRITKLDYGNNTVYSQGTRWGPTVDGVIMLKSLNEFPPPRYINWGKASISRITSSLDDGLSRRELVLATSGASDGYGLSVTDPLVADRVEYAMRFLQASCDETASTGF